MISLLIGLLFILSPRAQVLEEKPEILLHKEFVSTAFGVKSRTLDKKDAEAVIKALHQFKIDHPEAHISRVEVLTCTSDYKLPQISITHKETDEHLRLAKDRLEMLKEEMKKASPYPFTGKAQVCGPAFKKEDMNDRFVTRESGAIFDEKFKILLADSAFIELLKSEALLENPSDLKSIYSSPFLAKYKPFQGVRLLVWGSLNQVSPKKREGLKKPSGKIQ